MGIKLFLLAIFFGVMAGVGLYARKHAGNVDDFVLGGRSVGPWLTAFAYGTSYFSAVVFVGYAGQFGWKYGLASTWIGIGNALIVIFIAISVVLALDPPTFIAQLMGISWGALAGAFLAPFLYGLCWKRVTRPAVWASFICGVGITVVNMSIHFIQSPINAGAVAMIAGLVAVPVVSLLTPVFDKQEVEEIFSCYDETVSVRKKTSLPDKA